MPHPNTNLDCFSEKNLLSAFHVNICLFYLPPSPPKKKNCMLSSYTCNEVKNGSRTSIEENLKQILFFPVLFICELNLQTVEEQRDPSELPSMYS